MKISFLNRIKYPLGILVTAGVLSAAPVRGVNAQNSSVSTELQEDRFEKTRSARMTDSLTLKKAPNPELTIYGEKKLASIVVDIKRNLLYRYNDIGQAVEAFKVACGASSTPTPSGVSVVTDIQEFPYLTVPAWTKRRKNPQDYGPKLIELNVVDTITGDSYNNGVFIHGTKNPNAIGKKVTHGCVRLHNKDILYLADLVKIGQYVRFIK